MEYLTTHEDDNGAEWDIKLAYTISPAEPMQPNPDHPMFGPGCDAEVEFTPYRLEPYQIGGVESGAHWVVWEGYSEEEEDRWIAEIFEQEADQ